MGRLLCRDPDPAEAGAFVEAYVREWNTGVVYPLGIMELVGTLADRFRLAVVTNTHKADLVPRHLAAMGIAHHFDTVVTSIEVGWRKPHPAIYATALLRLGITAGNAVFVGDSYAADYAGPVAAGLTAFLIDPDEKHGVPPDRRLRSLFDLPHAWRLTRTPGQVTVDQPSLATQSQRSVLPPTAPCDERPALAQPWGRGGTGTQ